MTGKSGQWGTPFTKGNANAMRLRGLETRRWKSEKRLARELCEGESTKRETRETRSGVGESVPKQAQLASPGPSQPSQPSEPPKLNAVKPRPAFETRAVPPYTGRVPVLQPGEELCYGYQIAPGVWVEAKPPARNPNGLLAVEVLRASRPGQGDNRQGLTGRAR